jgi:hypothetical protein
LKAYDASARIPAEVTALAWCPHDLGVSHQLMLPYWYWTDHPGAQELIWGLGDYPTTPEAHARKIRHLGEQCWREAEQALKTVKKNKDGATAVFNSMKAYNLLTDYYERKILAAVSALIYSFGGGRENRADAERLADEAVARYETAMHFIWEQIDKKTGNVKARWGGRQWTLPELIENERKERAQLATLFNWSER